MPMTFPPSACKHRLDDAPDPRASADTRVRAYEYEEPAVCGFVTYPIAARTTP